MPVAMPVAMPGARMTTDPKIMGLRIRAAREAAGLTQAGLADRLNEAAGEGDYGGCTAHQVYRWEKGLRGPKRWRPFLEQVLDLDLGGYRDQTPSSMGMTSMGLTTEVPVDRRQFIGAGAIVGFSVTAGTPASAKGRRLGSTDVAHFSQRIRDLRRLDDLSGGVSTLPLAVAEIRTLSSLATHGTYTQKVARDLLSTLAELYQFTSWVAFDAQRTGDARRLALAASNAAHQAGNRELGATALSELAYITASTNTPAEGVSMARASFASASDAIPAVRVVLADRLAWACARVGDAEGVRRATGMSEEAHDQRDRHAVEEPDTVYWINRDESAIMAGRCWSELGSPRAARVLEAVEPPYDETHAREVALYRLWLAEARRAAGDVEEGAALAASALALSHQTASPRLDTITRAAVTAFRPHRGVASVRELLDMPLP